MTVGQLIARLNELVEANPNNAKAEVRWWDDFEAHIALGEGQPINLYKYPFHNGDKIVCVLNNIDGNPDYGFAIPIKDNGDTEAE